MEKFTLAVTMCAVLPVLRGEMKVVDLTWAHGSTTVYWPGNPPFNFTILKRENVSNHWYESNWFATAEHGGTHLDAPSHFFEGSWRMHQIPPERLIGPAVVIDVRPKVKDNPDYRVTTKDFTNYEAANGRIPKGAIVMMNSGWDLRYPNKSLTFNTTQTDNPATFHFPGFHQEGISWLLTNRDISMVGVDTPSVDYGQSTDFIVHVILARDNKLGLENVANLDKIPVKGATVFVGAIKLFDGSGGPARILATFDQDDRHCDCTSGFETSSARVIYVLASLLIAAWGM